MTSSTYELWLFLFSASPCCVPLPPNTVFRFMCSVFWYVPVWVCRTGNDVGRLFLIAVHVTLSRWDLSLNLEVAFCPGLLTSELEFPNIDTSTQSHAQLLCGCWGFQPRSSCFHSKFSYHWATPSSCFHF